MTDFMNGELGERLSGGVYDKIHDLPGGATDEIPRRNLQEMS